MPHQRGGSTAGKRVTLWSIKVHKEPLEALKFTLNILCCTMQTQLCGGKVTVCRNTISCGGKKTLAHILNHCQVALDLRRYNAVHNAVLEVTGQFVREKCPPDVEAITDLPAYNYTSKQALKMEIAEREQVEAGTSNSFKICTVSTSQSQQLRLLQTQGFQMQSTKATEGISDTTSYKMSAEMPSLGHMANLDIQKLLNTSCISFVSQPLETVKFICAMQQFSQLAMAFSLGLLPCTYISLTYQEKRGGRE